jgi:lysophospholipase L1-like esterase
MSSMAQTGMSGFTLYVGAVYHGTFVPPAPVPAGKDKGYDGIINFPDKRRREITVYFPLYNGVDEVYLGLEEGALVLTAGEYTCKKPIVFYGSSITQGCCASRPGNSYDAIVCRNLDSDYINAGLSGQCRAETAMAEYLSTIDARVFVYDYDYNAPDAEYLRKTHYRFYQRYRKKKKNVPVIMISRPGYYGEALSLNNVENSIRRDIITESYNKGVAGGDGNLYFIDGGTFFRKKNADCCTVDGIHPNDLGFMRMAETVTPLMKKILDTSRTKPLP